MRRRGYRKYHFGNGGKLITNSIELLYTLILLGAYEIDTKIREQISIYMPAIQIGEVRFLDSEQDTNSLVVMISYYLPGISVSDLLQFTI